MNKIKIVCLFFFMLILFSRVSYGETISSNSFSVTVPTSLSISVDADGNVSTSDNCAITNNSTGIVTIESIQVIPTNDWTLVDYTTDFSKEKVGLTEFGFQINGSFADTEGYIDSKVLESINPNSSLFFDYDANIAVQSKSLSTNIANVVFILGYQELEYPYTIVFNGNGGSGVMDAMIADANSSVRLLSNTYTNNGVTFLGWSLNKNDDEPMYLDGAMVSNLNPNKDENIVLYAIWSKREYQITYNANGGLFESGNNIYTETKIEDKSYNITYEKPILNQYVVIEWNTKPDGSDMSYIGGNGYVKDEELTLYAIWHPDSSAFADFDNTGFVNMGTGAKGKTLDIYSGVVNCTTQSGADGMAIPLMGLKSGTAYRMFFSVTFDSLVFYTDDPQTYMFGTNILEEYEGYHKTMSIFSQAGATKNHIAENMRWSTESNGVFDATIEFIATSDTMYWFWETTDIYDGTQMTYKFDNYYLIEIDKPVPHIEFEHSYVTYMTAPFCNTADKTGGTPYNNKNYHKTEEYRFDYFKFRTWGYGGHEVMTIPISGLKVGKTYTIDFTQKLNKASFYYTDLNNLNNHHYGCVVIGNNTITSSTGQTLDNNAGYVELTSPQGSVKDFSVTFTATAETMYWMWAMGNLRDGTWSKIELSNVDIYEITPLSLLTINTNGGESTLQTYELDNGSSEMIEYGEVLAGEIVDLTVAKDILYKENAELLGFNLDPLAEDGSFYFKMPTTDVILYAIWGDTIKCTCNLIDNSLHNEDCSFYEPFECDCEGEHIEGCPLYIEENICTCGLENSVHSIDCPNTEVVVENILEKDDISDISEAGDISDIEDIEDIVDVSDIEDIGDIGDIGDAGDISDIENVGDVSDIGDIEDVGDISDIENVRDVSDIGDIGDAGDIKEIGDIDDVDDIEDVEEIGDVDDISDIENIKVVEDVVEVVDTDKGLIENSINLNISTDL